MFTVGVKSAGTVRQQSCPKRGDQWHICLKKKKEEKIKKKSFGLFRFEFFCLPFSTSAEQFDLYSEVCGRWKTDSRTLLRPLHGSQNEPPQRKSRQGCFKSPPRLTRQSQSERGKTHHHRQSFCISLLFNGHVTPSSSSPCDSTADITRQTSEATSTIGQEL